MIEQALGQKPAVQSVFRINWAANPFRGDEFERVWQPAAAAALDFGALGYAFLRSKEDPLQFSQFAVFESEVDFERYWYSEELERYKVAASGLFQVPVLPIQMQVVGFASLFQPAVES